MSTVLAFPKDYTPSYAAAEYEIWLSREDMRLSPIGERFRAARERYHLALSISHEAYIREFTEQKRTAVWL